MCVSHWQLTSGCGLDEKHEDSTFPVGGKVAKPVLLPELQLLLLLVSNHTLLAPEQFVASVDYQQPSGTVLKHRNPLRPWTVARPLSIPDGWQKPWPENGLVDLNDPRGIMWNGKALVVFNGPFTHSGCNADKTLVVATLFGENETVVLLPPSQAIRPSDALRRVDHGCPIEHDEKNWSPLVVHGRLLFVYQHNPLQIVKLPTGDDTSRLIGGRVAWEFKQSSSVSSSSPCSNVRGGTPYTHWRGPYHVALGHVHCGVITDVGCRMEEWGVGASSCSRHRRTPMSWNHSCSRAYRSVLTVLDTSKWELSCSPRLTFRPPPFWQCEQGWRGKWDVQYVHSLVRAQDGQHMLVGMEFNNRCPSVIRVPMSDFTSLVEATLAGAMTPDVVSNAPKYKVGPMTARWAY